MASLPEPMNELEQRWRDLGEFIREQRRIGHLSLRKLSEMAGISNPYLSQIERGLRKPSAEILQQIARALEISSETLYVRAGILEEREGEHDLVSEIRRDPFLTEEQKKTLVHIYESFAAETKAAYLATGAAPDELVTPADDTPADDTPAPVAAGSGNGAKPGANGSSADPRPGSAGDTGTDPPASSTGTSSTGTPSTGGSPPGGEG
jgi:transcriptional regulator with XRE-family HTH domain